MLALTLMTLPSQTQSLSGDRLPAAGMRQVLLSHAPSETELPPLAVSIGRLANESALAACWAMRLHPQGSGCAGEDAAR